VPIGECLASTFQVFFQNNSHIPHLSTKTRKCPKNSVMQTITWHEMRKRRSCASYGRLQMRTYALPF
jgi:hypothetical protein